jgi:hypothetical protein
MNDLLLRRIQQQGGSPTPPTPPIPSEYLQLSYLHISGAGNPIFDLGLRPYNDDLTPRGLKMVFSVDSVPINTRISFFSLTVPWNRSWYYRLYIPPNTQYINFSEANYSTLVVSSNIKHTITVSCLNQTITLDNTTAQIATQMRDQTINAGSISNLYISNPPGWGWRTDFCIYEHHVLNEYDNIIGSFYPVMRISDSVLGLWDSINQTFTTNSSVNATITAGY